VRALPLRAWLLAVASGVLQVLVFPSPSIYALCWIALTPLLIAILGPVASRQGIFDRQGRNLTAISTWQGFLLGYCSGVVWYAGSCFWVYHVMHVYGGLSVLAGIGVWVLFCLYLALYHGVFGAMLARAARHDDSPQARQRALLRALVLTPFLWVAVELARARITGFPWDLLGTAQVDNIPLTRLAVVTGVYGVSFIIALVNAGLVAALFSAPAHRSRMLSAAFAVALMLQLGTFAQPHKFSTSETAVLVQQNISLDLLWTPSFLDQTLTELHTLSKFPEGSRGSLRLMVWPESPAPFFDNNPTIRNSLSQLARNQNAYIVAGTLGTFAREAQAQETGDIANRAVLITPTGEWVARYDKIHLVPFGEYVPFKSVFVFADKLTREVGNFRRGTERTVFSADGHRLAAFICYESVFPDEIRQFAQNGAQVFINISNDGWYGPWGAPGQHLNMARMRAIENRRWVLRATNTGITASIDPFGRVVAQAPRDIRTSLIASYNFESYTTLYTRYGDWFAYACAIISLVVVFVRFRVRATVLRGWKSSRDL
jgi:apolipoprotein N-acyltransferase